MNKEKKNKEKTNNSELPQINFEEAVKLLLQTPPKKQSEINGKKKDKGEG